jgi:hypothetical protein
MTNKLLAQGALQQIQSQAGLGVGGANFHFQIGTTIGELIATLLPFVFTIAGMLLLVYLILGGLQLMLSRGDPKAAQGAKSHISNALIGFIIVFIAYWVVQIFGTLLGLPGIASIFH